LLFSLSNYDIRGLMGFWSYLDMRFFCRLEVRFSKSVKKFELCLLRYYLVHAIQHGKKDKVFEFFDIYSQELVGNPDWLSWFCKFSSFFFSVKESTKFLFLFFFFFP